MVSYPLRISEKWAMFD